MRNRNIGSFTPFFFCLCLGSFSLLAQVSLPYHRDIQSAGKVLRFGDPRLENHALDIVPMPDDRYLAIEDRYGVCVLDRKSDSIIDRWSFQQDSRFKGLKSTFSGIKSFVYADTTWLAWGASEQEKGRSGIQFIRWQADSLQTPFFVPIPAKEPAPISLPNEVEVAWEGKECYLYVALNGNNELLKMRFRDRQMIWSKKVGVAPFGVRVIGDKVYVSNWGGPIPTNEHQETAGVPWGAAYVAPATGATSTGSISVLHSETGELHKEIPVLLHPNAMVVSPDQQMLYVANGNSDAISVINTQTDAVVQHIPVSLFHTPNGKDQFWGSSPNALAIHPNGRTLFVSNGMDNAIAVVNVATSTPGVLGFIPTEAYPAGLVYARKKLYVCNLEGEGAHVPNKTASVYNRFPALTTDTAFLGVYNAHEQLASLSILKSPVKSRKPDTRQLKAYTETVQQLNFSYREALSVLKPRSDIPARPVPERIGEPSVFKHVVYIIKENRTYDQVYGDLPQGNGMPALCVFGNDVTPNQHKLALEYSLLDNYHASGKSSAEGHQWTDAGMVSDYVEKSVRGWFRSYPHRQYDAMVYTPNGFIWNHALDYGKRVRIYGEACFLEFDETLSWTDIYRKYKNNEPFEFVNTSTISRVRPLLAQSFPGYDDPKISDQMRADAFIAELKAFEQTPDRFPELLIIALPNDHTAGTSPGFPTPRAQVADNDLALGKIVDALTKSRFWDSTVVFVTEDDSQGGWDHVSPYRTGALVISPYSRIGKTVSTEYNQLSMFRTMEQILGLPPMHSLDATAIPMFDCFTDQKAAVPYPFLPNRIPLDEMNATTSQLRGKALEYAKQSEALIAEEGIDNGQDDLMNRILWFATKGDVPYPVLPGKK